MLSKSFKIYLFIIFFVLALVSPFYISFVHALNYAGDFDNTSPSEVNFTASDFNFDGSDPFSLEVWFFVESGTNQFVNFVSKMEGATEYKGYEFMAETDTNQMDFRFVLRNKFTATDNVLSVDTGGSVVVTNSWQHVVVTYDGSKDVSGVIIYLNAVSKSLTTNSNTLTGDISNTAPFRIGVNHTDGEYMNGFLDEVRIWDKELTSYEVGHLYNSGDGTYSIPEEVAEVNLLATYRFDENTGTDILDSTGTADGTSTFLNYTTGKVEGTSSPVTFSFSTSTTDVLLGEWYSVSYNATSTSGALQNCALWIPFYQEWIFADNVSGQSCELEVLVENAHIGENAFVGSAVVDWTAYYSDDFIVTGHIDEDLDEYDPSAIPTITFVAENSTTTIGVENTWTIESDDDIMVTKVQVWNPELSSWVVFGSGNSSSSLDVDYDWTPFMAGSYYFTARVYDNHGQIGEPDPLYVRVVVYEDIDGEISYPMFGEFDTPPDSHFLIETSTTFISFLHLDDIWNWFVSLFKEKFPFSWFYGIFDIWSEQRDTISTLVAIDPLKVTWTLPTSTPAFAGATFTLFDLQTPVNDYPDFFNIIRVIFINILWLGFASIVFFKVKKFIGDMSIND